ncbi:hypothetical protein EYF80_037485 [Liparis tanakae]|uniref:Uncharacterized protein n=1 Tax=Liparis tanakae TaxID=230148 RepID=A0A4Z2GGI2_9TELE|nr:hypothetical protein EYF80_037485 [Liparis tanakae]
MSLRKAMSRSDSVSMMRSSSSANSSPMVTRNRRSTLRMNLFSSSTSLGGDGLPAAAARGALLPEEEEESAAWPSFDAPASGRRSAAALHEAAPLRCRADGMSIPRSATGEGSTLSEGLQSAQQSSVTSSSQASERLTEASGAYLHLGMHTLPDPQQEAALRCPAARPRALPATLAAGGLRPWSRGGGASPEGVPEAEEADPPGSSAGQSGRNPSALPKSRGPRDSTRTFTSRKQWLTMRSWTFTVVLIRIRHFTMAPGGHRAAERPGCVPTLSSESPDATQCQLAMTRSPRAPAAARGR